MLLGATRLADRTLRRNNPTPPERDSERLGHTAVERPKGCLLWLHVNDPSEAGCISALTAELSSLRDEPVFGLVTSLANTLPFSANDKTSIHQLVPGDTRGSVKRFLDHWQPDVGVIAGPADRPTLLSEAHAAGIPMFLAANTRASAISGNTLGAQSFTIPEIFSGVLVANSTDQKALTRLGLPAERSAISGPLCDTALPPPCKSQDFLRLSKILGGRPVWLAAEVTAAEIPILEAAQRRTIRAAHRLLLIIVPRDPAEGLAIAGSLETHGWRTALRSAGGQPDENVQVYIVDTDEGMGLWYRASPITYLGGSFDPGIEISDPYGPAAMGSSIIHGPEINGAVARMRRLRAANASKPITSPDDLGDAVFQLLSPDQAALLAHAAWATTSEGAPAIEALVTMISRVLDGEETR
ncbi:3-deoxy-D-manno-octulosonic acid transferase [Boseongicola aestuarii]|uniref:3-deoxy-D-manno-octulosonic acid transferase n=1 Tax=Boseongicola aestuarii TaxID=1470561 RepID=A0A238IZ40_9RHOB|nr:glycosyltransferase N-terminal domain-containing protein [Boseongicola aestuarii]SMX23252.1 3-deoxy-D-manno-octulosonic acid transferase [Boseongicola aestuarii]